jgi:hypothetical protein
MQIQCRNCYYYNAKGQTAGTCKRFPPVLVSLTPAQWAQPTVDALEMCGEFSFEGTGGGMAAVEELDTSAGLELSRLRAKNQRPAVDPMTGGMAARFGTVPGR